MTLPLDGPENVDETAGYESKELSVVGRAPSATITMRYRQNIKVGNIRAAGGI